MKKFFKFIFKSIISISVIFCLFMSLVFYCNLSPFKNLRTLWVTTAMTTFTHQWLATAFISPSEIDRIMNENKVIVTNAKTITSKISNTENTSNSVSDSSSSSTKALNVFSTSNQISVIDIKDTNYVGKLMIVDNPARIQLGIIDHFGSSYKGLQLAALAQKYSATAAINCSGFNDPDGEGNGGTPIGVVVKDGTIIYHDNQQSYSLVGFDTNNKLVTGQYTLAEIYQNNIKNAVSFGPCLIINGNAAEISGNGGSGYQPRTAIGQTIDGKVLLLEIDGRQPLYSIGATLKDVQNIMIKYGAINACNLDGGSSSGMYYQGNLINKPCGPLGSSGGRYLPTAFLVMPQN